MGKSKSHVINAAEKGFFFANKGCVRKQDKPCPCPSSPRIPVGRLRGMQALQQTPAHSAQRSRDRYALKIREIAASC